MPAARDCCVCRGRYLYGGNLAVHLPVPIVVAIRMFSGLGFEPISYPVLIGAFFLGQFVGTRLGKVWNRTVVEADGIDRLSA